MSKAIVMASPLDLAVEPEPEPIRSDWVLSGSPMARTRRLARSHDWLSHMVYWECSAGTFNWHYARDETLVVLSGEAFISNAQGEERRLGVGDFAYFPAGSSCRWRVPQCVKKIAIVRQTMWRPLAFGVKALSKALRVAGIAGESPL